MERFYVNDNAKETGEHEVHIEGCPHFPRSTSYIGLFSNYPLAIEMARTIYLNVDGCDTCCKPFLTKGDLS